MPTPAGIVSSAISRMPERRLADERGAVAPGDGPRHLGLERGRDRHREQSVREHEERERVEVRGGVARPGIGEVADTTISATWLAATKPSVQPTA